ncbi:type II secretion system GspH family protein [Massilia sp. P8910]|uniref:type II secretion system protein n=1 Tax=Massilia antarctica TaxID=2765360 RepID=UPI0006BB60F6|nr:MULTISPECIES: type II secretion system protein [Massilia]MCE3604124.1 type II secretion system GspH family protein [Massilia antarctica]MCY0910420.1 type II secretion system protein [Massilia sp. H27-R4]CUI09233.1 MSHA biogenesis protein MshO [Janthinobacterium sp. CG23_2]CUU33019.1 MSHA biogenesis protein MshO [Janthinobacterium sp. CG23_2]
MMPPSRQHGFTLVEAIVVIVITGILGGIVATFLRLPVQNYVDSAGRAELTDVADTAVRRMVRELRLALPNTVRVAGAAGTSIEFVPTKTGGRYLAAEDVEAGQHLNFVNSADLDFRVVGPLQGGTQQIVAGDTVVVNNMSIDADLANVYAAVPTNRAQVTAVDAPNKLITLAANPFAAQNPPMAHPLHRFQVIGQPVTYSCANGMLYRHANYGYNAVQNPVPSAAPAILATNVESCEFNYFLVGNTRSALVRLTLTLRRANGNDGAIRLIQQVHVDNNP